MRAHIFVQLRLANTLLFLMYSEIFQVTGPIRRTAAMLAGHGFIVACPEIYHELEPAGSLFLTMKKALRAVMHTKSLKNWQAMTAMQRAVLKYLNPAKTALAVLA